LGARQIVHALVELAEANDYRNSRTRGALDAGYFHALTSFVSITRRAPLSNFCQAMIAQLSPAVRASCQALIRELLPTAGYPQLTWSLSEYEPVRRTSATRQAAFSANLVSLAVLLFDGPVDVADLVGEPVVVNWRRQALLWLGQLDYEDSRRMWQAFRVWWLLDVHPTRLLIRVEDGVAVSVISSLPWPFEDRPGPSSSHKRAAGDALMPAESDTGRSLRKSAFAQTAIDTRELIYTLIPFWRRIGDITHVPTGASEESDARLVMETALSLLQPDNEPESYIDGLMAALDVVLASGELGGTFAKWLIRAFPHSLRPKGRTTHYTSAAIRDGDIDIGWNGRLTVTWEPPPIE
jgi:hypothetical protein